MSWKTHNILISASYNTMGSNETMRLYPGALSGSQRAPMKGSGGKAIGP